MKKLFSVFFAILMLLTILAGCGSKSLNSDNPSSNSSSNAVSENNNESEKPLTQADFTTDELSSIFVGYNPLVFGDVISIETKDKDIDELMSRAFLCYRTFSNASSSGLLPQDMITIFLDPEGGIIIKQIDDSEVSSEISFIEDVNSARAEEIKTAYDKYFS